MRIVFLALILFLTACSQKPEPIKVLMQCQGKYVRDWAEHNCARDL